jgi:plastocyanin
MRSRALLPAVILSVVHCIAAHATTWQVTVQSLSYDPAELHIRVGDSVQWTNNSGTHSVLAADGSFRCANGCDDTGGSGAPATNWSFTRAFRGEALSRTTVSFTASS